MQQPAALRVRLLAQVELQLPPGRLRSQPQPALDPREVPLQRDGGRGGRYLPEDVADDQPVVHQCQRHVRALAQHRPRRVGRLAQPGQRPSAQRREGLRQPHGLDDVRRRHAHVLGPQQPRHLGQPPFHRPVRGVEQVLVPAGGFDARAVAARPGEPAVGPGHPGHVRPHLGQPLQQGPVGGDGGPPPERGHVPGPAHHGHAVPALPPCRADPQPHVGLAHQVPLVPPAAVLLPERGHGLLERGEGRDRVPLTDAPVLDDVLPPPLGVVVPGGPGQHPQRIDPHVGARRVAPTGRGSGAAVLAVALLVPLPGQGVGGGQVDEAGRDVVLQRPADRGPLRGEPGQRPEGRTAGLVHRVGEQRDRRPHVLLGGERDQRVRLGRALDQHHVRTGLVEGGAHRPRRPGAVVPHPEQQRCGGVPAAVAHAPASRQAR